MNVCGCGAQPGYQHDPACPRPLYNAGEREWDRWDDDYRANKAAILAGEVKP